MGKDERIERTEQFVRESLTGEATGHDFWHVERVWRMARFLAQKEGGDLLVVELAALLHDIADWKFHGGDLQAGARKGRLWLQAQGLDAERIEAICRIIENISFKGARTEEAPLSLEGQLVQDADRLDAIGAIGIARTFAYGGSIGQPLFDPSVKPKQHATAAAYYHDKTHTINHFYEKLLLLKERLHTRTAKALAEERHAFMERFLERFYQEWNWGD